MRQLRNHRGFTGLEIIALSFIGSMLAMFIAGIIVGIEVHRTLKKFNLAEYQMIQNSLGYSYAQNSKRNLYYERL